MQCWRRRRTGWKPAPVTGDNLAHDPIAPAADRREIVRSLRPVRTAVQMRVRPHAHYAVADFAPIARWKAISQNFASVYWITFFAVSTSYGLTSITLLELVPSAHKLVTVRTSKCHLRMRRVVRL